MKSNYPNKMLRPDNKVIFLDLGAKQHPADEEYDDYQFDSHKVYEVEVAKRRLEKQYQKIQKRKND